MENPQKPGAINIPAKSQHQIEVIIAKDAKELQEKTNKFLLTINDEKRLISLVFSTNAFNGNLIQIVNYAFITPMTKEEWLEKQEKQKKFAEAFDGGSLMPDKEGEKPAIEKLN